MRHLLLSALLPATLLFGAPCAAMAGEPVVEKIEADRAADGSWRFAVTVRHADEGWDHYADAWEVVAPDGTVRGTSELLHPHENEQPFTRARSGIVIPDGVDHVMVRARDKAHGWGAGVPFSLP